MERAERTRKRKIEIYLLRRSTSHISLWLAADLLASVAALRNVECQYNSHWRDIQCICISGLAAAAAFVVFQNLLCLFLVQSQREKAKG